MAICKNSTSRLLLLGWGVTVCFLWPRYARSQFTTVLHIPPDPGITELHQGVGADTQLNLYDGGEIGSFFSVSGDNNETNVFGGTVSHGLTASNGATVNISGGTIGNLFTAHRGSIVNLTGGTIEQHMTVRDGGVFNMTGGTVGRDLHAWQGGIVNITGGTVADEFLVSSGSVVHISGGEVGPRFSATRGSYVRITGGTHFGFPTGGHIDIAGDPVIGNFSTVSFATANVSGGTFHNNFYVGPQSAVNITGGVIDTTFKVSPQADVRLLGSQFVLDGVDLTPSLTPNVPLVITDREVTLSGVLADGSAFDFDLHSLPIPGQDYVYESAELSIALVSPGDIELDGDVDGADFLRWQAEEGTVASFLAWEQSYGEPLAALNAPGLIPEPSTAVLIYVMGGICFWRRIA